MYGTHFIVVI